MSDDGAAAEGPSGPARSPADGMALPDAADGALDEILEETLAALLDAAPVGFLVLDRDLRYLRANRRLTEPAGLTREDYLGRSPAELRPDIAPLLLPHAEHVLATGESVEGLMLSGSQVPTGQGGHWLASFHPIGTPDDVLAVGMLLTDVTEQVERAEQLERSQALLAETERIAGVGSWNWNVEDREVELTEEARRIFDLGAPGQLRWPLDEMLARLHPDDLQLLVGPAELALRDGTPFDAEFRLVRGGDQVRTIREHGEVVTTSEGTVTRMRGTVQDVTELTAIERQVALWTAVVDRLPVGVAVVRADPDVPGGAVRVVATNAAVRSEWFDDGRVLDTEALGRLVGPDLPAGAVLDAARRAVQERTSVEVGEAVVPDGRRFVLQVFPVGDPQEVGVVVEDVTEQRRLQQERVDLLQRSVSAADQERLRIAGRLHDEAIQLLAAGLLRLDEAMLEHDDPRLGQVRDAVDAAVVSLRETILEVSPRDLAEEGLHTALADWVERMLEADDVEVDLQVDLGAADVPDRVLAGAYQVVQESLANVRRHARASHVLVRVEVDDGALVGEVVDDGVGLRVGGRTRTDAFGLRLMVERVELLGGRVHVAPRRDAGGTRVRFELPLHG